MANRQLQVVAGPDNTMLVDDTATDWGGEEQDDHRAVQTWRDPLVAAAEPAAGGHGPVESVRVEFTVGVAAGDPNAVISVANAAGAPVAGSVTQKGKAFVFTPAQPLARRLYSHRL